MEVTSQKETNKKQSKRTEKEKRVRKSWGEKGINPGAPYANNRRFRQRKWKGHVFLNLFKKQSQENLPPSKDRCSELARAVKSSVTNYNKRK